MPLIVSTSALFVPLTVTVTVIVDVPTTTEAAVMFLLAVKVTEPADVLNWKPDGAERTSVLPTPAVSAKSPFAPSVITMFPTVAAVTTTFANANRATTSAIAPRTMSRIRPRRLAMANPLPQAPRRRRRCLQRTRRRRRGTHGRGALLLRLAGELDLELQSCEGRPDGACEDEPEYAAAPGGYRTLFEQPQVVDARHFAFPSCAWMCACKAHRHFPARGA